MPTKFDHRLELWLKFAIWISFVGSIALLILWPTPIHVYWIALTSFLGVGQ